MKHAEELLHRAQKKEKIVIDQDFKQSLKQRILSTPPAEPAYDKNFVWRRFSILLVPALVSLTLFFYFYDTGSKYLPLKKSVNQEQAEDATAPKSAPSPATAGSSQQGNAVSENAIDRDTFNDEKTDSYSRPTGGTESGILSPLDKPGVATLSSSSSAATGPETATKPFVVLALLFACLTIMVVGVLILKKSKRRK